MGRPCRWNAQRQVAENNMYLLGDKVTNTRKMPKKIMERLCWYRHYSAYSIITRRRGGEDIAFTTNNPSLDPEVI
jgi:hypothetical protein